MKCERNEIGRTLHLQTDRKGGETYILFQIKKKEEFISSQSRFSQLIKSSSSLSLLNR